MLMSVEFQFGMMVVARVARVNVHIATEHKKMLKMITFILCVFYDNFLNEVRKSPNTRDSVAQRALAAPGCTGSEDQRGRPQWWPRPSFPRSASHRSSHHMGPWGLKQRSQRSDRTTEARHIDFKREKRHY